MVIELEECNLVWNHSVIRVISQSDERVRARSASSIVKSQVWFQTKIARHEVQLALYYRHFEIAEFSQCQYFIDQVAGLLKSVNKRAFSSHFAFEAEMMRFKTKIYDLEHEWRDLEQTWFRAKIVWFVNKSHCWEPIRL